MLANLQSIRRIIDADVPHYFRNLYQLFFSQVKQFSAKCRNVLKKLSCERPLFYEFSLVHIAVYRL